MSVLKSASFLLHCRRFDDTFITHLNRFHIYLKKLSPEYILAAHNSCKTYLDQQYLAILIFAVFSVRLKSTSVKHNKFAKQLNYQTELLKLLKDINSRSVQFICLVHNIKHVIQKYNSTYLWYILNRKNKPMIAKTMQRILTSLAEENHFVKIKH